jgi:hypothetical protein
MGSAVSFDRQGADYSGLAAGISYVVVMLEFESGQV